MEASDDMSGVEAVCVDDTRINSLVNGKGTVALKDYAGDGKGSDGLRGGLFRQTAPKR